MPEIDYSKLSNEELLKLAGVGKSVDYARMSDTELLTRAGITPEDTRKWNLTDLGKAAINQLPTAGAIVGGTLSSELGPGAIPFAGLGAAAGEKAKIEIQRKYFPEDAPSPGMEEFKQIGKEGLYGAAGEGTGQVIGVLGRAASRTFSNAGEKLRELFGSVRKPNAEEIIESAKRLGIEPTEGMLSKNPIIGKTESSLEQSPTIGGMMMRSKTTPIREKLAEKAKSLVPEVAPITKYEAGGEVKQLISGKAAEEVNKASILYEDLEKVLHNTPVDQKNLEFAKEAIMQTQSARLGAEGLAQKLVDRIGAIENLSDLKQVRTQLGLLYSNNNAENRLIDEAYGILTEFRNRSILGNPALKPADRRAAEAAIKEADSIYRGFFEKFRPIDEALGGSPSKTPDRFFTKLENVPTEAIGDKLFNVKNIDSLKEFQKSFPEEFSRLRDARIAAIAEKTSEDGVFNPGKFVNTVSKLEPEVRTVLFGENANKVLKDLHTVIEAFPKMSGPSGTPAGQEMIRSILSPKDQALSVPRYLLATNPKAVTEKFTKTGSAIERVLTNETANRFAGQGVSNLLAPNNEKAAKQGAMQRRATLIGR